MGPGFESLRVYHVSFCCLNYNPFLLLFRKGLFFILLSVTPARCRSHDSKRYSTVFNLQPAGHRCRATPAIVRRHIRVTVATNGFELSTFPVVEIRIVRKLSSPDAFHLACLIRPKVGSVRKTGCVSF